MLLTVVFDKKLVKFKIRNIIKQNTDETHLKQPKIHWKVHSNMDFKNLKEKIHELTVSRLLRNVCDFQKENHTLGYGFKFFYSL
jgi:hypothetical protein